MFVRPVGGELPPHRTGAVGAEPTSKFGQLVGKESPPQEGRDAPGQLPAKVSDKQVLPTGKETDGGGVPATGAEKTRLSTEEKVGRKHGRFWPGSGKKRTTERPAGGQKSPSTRLFSPSAAGARKEATGAKRVAHEQGPRSNEVPVPSLHRDREGREMALPAREKTPRKSDDAEVAPSSPLPLARGTAVKDTKQTVKNTVVKAGSQAQPDHERRAVETSESQPAGEDAADVLSALAGKDEGPVAQGEKQRPLSSPSPSLLSSSISSSVPPQGQEAASDHAGKAIAERKGEVEPEARPVKAEGAPAARVPLGSEAMRSEVLAVEVEPTGQVAEAAAKTPGPPVEVSSPVGAAAQSRGGAVFHQLVEQGINQLLASPQGAMVRQLQLQLGGAQQADIRLSLQPESLGEVRLFVQLNDRQAVTHIRVDNAQTAQLMEGALESFAQGFSDHGYHQQDFAVVVEQRQARAGTVGELTSPPPSTPTLLFDQQQINYMV